MKNLLAKFIAAKLPPQYPRSYAALWSPSNELGELTDRMGAKGEMGIMTKMSLETTTSLQVDAIPTKVHPNAARRHPTPFEGWAGKGGSSGKVDDQQLILVSHQQGERRQWILVEPR
jgi:hypothetical protein